MVDLSSRKLDYQCRLVQEREQLNDKIIKLSAFLYSGSHMVEGMDLMRDQLRCMLDYSDTLSKRIDQFK